jgi:hypothetical protein
MDDDLWVWKTDCLPSSRVAFKAALADINSVFSDLHFISNELKDDEQFCKYVQAHEADIEDKIKEALTNFRAGVVLEIAHSEGDKT